MTTILRRAKRLSLSAAVAGQCAVALVSMTIKPQLAAAEVNFNPYGSASVESNSNVFALPGAGTYGITSLGDTISEYIAGLSSNGTWGDNTAKVNLEARNFQYDKYVDLDHFEFAGDGTLDWHLGPITETILTYSQSRIAANFADTLGSQLEINTTKLASATIRVLITPEWRVGVAPALHEYDTPLQGYADFRLRETAGDATLDYLGIASVVMGLDLNYTSGQYNGIYNATNYHQDSAKFTASYKVTDKSSLTGDIGYTKRETSLNPEGSIGVVVDPNLAAQQGLTGATATFTGDAIYSLKITEKTTLNVQLFRRIESYVAGANSEIGTGGQIGLQYQPDFRFQFQIDYQHENDDIQGNLVIADVIDRHDKAQWADFQAKYFIQNWLNLKAFARRDLRDSTLSVANYNATIYGIELDAKLQ